MIDELYQSINRRSRLWPEDRRSAFYFDVASYKVRAVSSLSWGEWFWYRFRFWRVQAWMSGWDYRFRMRYRDRWLRCKHGILMANCAVCPEHEERVQ